MKAVNLEEINQNVLALRKLVESMSEVILEDSLELSDEVIAEIKASRKKPRNSFISQENVEAEFLDEC
ncbi:MAG: hypothetical protein U9Q73_01985 [Nanoarchaeota archaeon]|nr:hypothetical protein [Nanoarchaeota archaeon]